MASVQVKGDSIKLYKRFLYDSISSQIFMSKSLATVLELNPIKKDKLLVYTFANRNAIKQEYDFVNIIVITRHPPHASLKFKAFVSAIISATQVNSHIDSLS